MSSAECPNGLRSRNRWKYASTNIQSKTALNATKTGSVALRGDHADPVLELAHRIGGVEAVGGEVLHRQTTHGEGDSTTASVSGLSST